MTDTVKEAHVYAPLPEAKNCPACKRAEPLAVITDEYKRYVWCPSCGTRGPCVSSHGGMLTKEEAIQAWNGIPRVDAESLESLHQHSKLASGSYDYQCGFLDALALAKNTVARPVCDVEAELHEISIALLDAVIWFGDYAVLHANKHTYDGDQKAAVNSHRAEVMRKAKEKFDHLASRNLLPGKEGWVLVPQSALDWLFGSGPDAEGFHFHESHDAYRATNIGKIPAFWWRSHFRKLISAAPIAAGGE